MFSLVAGHPVCVCVVGAGRKLASWKGHAQTVHKSSNFPHHSLPLVKVWKGRVRCQGG